MFVEYCGRKLVPRISASREMTELHLDLLDVLDVLESGFDCSSGGSRKAGVLEKCLRKDGKVL